MLHKLLNYAITYSIHDKGINDAFSFKQKVIDGYVTVDELYYVGIESMKALSKVNNKTSSSHKTVVCT